MSRSKGSKYSGFRYLRIMYDFKFDPIKAYLESTQEMILQQKNELSEKFDKWNKEHGKNAEVPDAYEMYEMEILNSSEFSSILNQSVYLTIYSTFESEFFEICELCRKIENLRIGAKDIMEQNYLGQCRKYIIKILNVNLDSLNEKWAEIKKYQQIRNSIAHNNGILKSPNEDILKFIENSNGISLDSEKSKVQMESIEFLMTMIDKLTDFLSETAELIMNDKNKSST